MVFFFTGTGNSLSIAKQIEKNPISIPQAIHQTPLEFTDDTIGIVAPVYGHEVPAMVKAFLQKGKFHTPYFYMVLTYGNRHGGAAQLAKQLCEECGIAPSYINIVLMVDNWLPEFDMDEQMKLDKNVSGQMQTIQELEPDATVVTDGLSISRNSVADAQSDVADWVASLNILP